MPRASDIRYRYQLWVDGKAVGPVTENWEQIVYDAVKRGVAWWRTEHDVTFSSRVRVKTIDE